MKNLKNQKIVATLLLMCLLLIFSSTFCITYGVEISKISISPMVVNIEKGKLQKLECNVTPSDAVKSNLKWSSNNKSVAVVTSNGLVLGVSKGVAIVTVSSSNGKTARCLVQVKETSVPVRTPTPTAVPVKTPTSTSVPVKTPTPTAIPTRILKSVYKRMYTKETFSLKTLIESSYLKGNNFSWKTNNSKLATVSSSGTVTTINPGTALITAQSNSGITYKFYIIITKKIEYKPIFSHSLNGKVIKSYSDSSINVKIEDYSKYYITKIWLKDPSKQVKKVEAGWGTDLKTVNTMLNATNGAIVGCNASGFYKSGAWTPSSQWDKGILRTSWNLTTEGNLVISNGIVRRKIAGEKCNTIMGILPNGSFAYFEGTSYDEVIKLGVKDTIAFGPLLLKDGKKYTQSQAFRLRKTLTESRQTSIIGQVDENNYIIITSKSGKNATLNEITNLGLQLKCKFLYNFDGGGSSSLWFRNTKSGVGTNIKGSRAVADALCFVSTAN